MQKCYFFIMLQPTIKWLKVSRNIAAPGYFVKIGLYQYYEILVFVTSTSFLL